MRISAVTFDVWETMIRDGTSLAAERDRLRVARMAAAMRRAGLVVSEMGLGEAYREAWHDYERVWATGSELDTREQVAVVLDRLDPRYRAMLDDAALRAVADGYVTPIFDLPPPLNDGLVDLLTLLRESGCPLGLICNTGRTPGYAMRRLFREYGVLDFFAAQAFSNEEGIRKPNPEIFRRVLNKLGACPSAAVHVGDDLDADILGAKQSGMSAVLIGQSCPIDPPAVPDGHIKSLRELPDVLQLLGARGER